MITLSLREALEHALSKCDDGEARAHIEKLLRQRVENKYETLVDECEVVMYG